MRYVRGVDRRQATLLPAVVDDYVGENSPVRVIEAFVDSLDMAELGFGRAEPASTGRPGYDPRDLLKLYVYGYLNEVRASRRMERECGRNVELMWLVRRLASDFRTMPTSGGTMALLSWARAALLCCSAGTRHLHADALHRMNARVTADPGLMRQRRCAPSIFLPGPSSE